LEDAGVDVDASPNPGRAARLLSKSAGGDVVRFWGRVTMIVIPLTVVLSVVGLVVALW
jgi:Na+/H+ antiporter NhaB